ncbi:PAS domain-containing protein [Reichenbachiella agarivorans]|uniref:histidine kinase n=1 Tax=Reichenbachiella agarivorans TaxID=2979464 RepID=A0ABY6CQ22_9BACT|nr:sensor histidine kinase [Reichenbachiella agarivorans]UXP32601.1 PAS domain-containing protein [Reichenbachiella agarivorans]
MDLYGIVGSLISFGLVGVAAIIFQKSKRDQAIEKAQPSVVSGHENTSYEHLKLLLDQAQKEAKLGTWNWDLLSDTLTWSDEIYHIFEFSKLNKPSISQIQKIIHEEDLEEYNHSISEIMLGKYPRRIQYRIRNQNNHIKHISEKREIIRDENGLPIRVLGTTQDISKQTQTTDYLFKTKSNYRLLTQTLPVGIYRSNKKGDILFVNKKMVEMFGFSSEEEMMQSQCQDFYHNQEYRSNLIDQLENDGMILDYKITFRRKDGSLFVGTENAQIEGDELHGVIQDVTERTTIEEEKNELISTLQRQNEDMERFAHIISHNLRCPLVNLVGLTQIMDRSTLSPDNNEIVDLMVLSTNNLDMIIKDLNKTVSIRGKKHEHYETVNLTKSLEQVKLELRESIIDHGATILSNISITDEILSIPSFINNILYQILDNAIKFHDPNRDPKVMITYTSTDKTAEFVIEDNGIGIDMSTSKDRLFKLYEKFYPKITGRGVGLYMTYNHINALKGSIHVDSQLGVGTRIHISLPKDNH